MTVPATDWVKVTNPVPALTTTQVNQYRTWYQNTYNNGNPMNAEMAEFLNGQSCELNEYDEYLVRRLIEKITVHHDQLTIEFKSCVGVDIPI